jgi:hypothetical protein
MRKNIFWTGGFDSTFRLLQLIEDTTVSEIYLYFISLVIDNVETSDVRRMSISYELETMKLILDSIDKSKIKQFTIIGKPEDLLYYTFQFPYQFMNYIGKDKIEYSDINKVYFFDLYVSGIVLRPITQWGAITEILDELDISAEICLEKGGGIWSRISKFVIDGKIQFGKMRSLSAFLRYQIPLFDVDREFMLDISKEMEWNSILELTWSCWYPKNNEQCGKCFTCVRRPKL